MDESAGGAPRRAGLDFSALNESVGRFQERFDEYVHSTVDQIKSDADTKKHDRKTAEAESSDLTRECDAIKQDQKQLWETVAAERREDTHLRSSLQAFYTQQKSLEQRTGELAGDVADARREFEALETRRAEKLALLERQVQLNRPELAVLEKYTGLSITPAERRGTLRFAFRLLSATTPNDACSLDLDVSQSQYTAPQYDARLSKETVQRLLQSLNDQGDLPAFLCALRRAMQAVCQ